MGLFGGTIQSGVSAKRNRREEARQFGEQLAYQKVKDAQELAFQKENAAHSWQAQAADRDTALAQLFKAQAIEARRAAMGRTFAAAMGNGGLGDAGSEATQRLLALLGKVQGGR